MTSSISQVLLYRWNPRLHAVALQYPWVLHTPAVTLLANELQSWQFDPQWVSSFLQMSSWPASVFCWQTLPTHCLSTHDPAEQTCLILQNWHAPPSIPHVELLCAFVHCPYGVRQKPVRHAVATQTPASHLPALHPGNREQLVLFAPHAPSVSGTQILPSM